MVTPLQHSIHQQITNHIIYHLTLNQHQINWSNLCENPTITWDIIKPFLNTHITSRKQFSKLSKHPNITPDIITANPSFPWSFYSLSSNPNVTWDFIQKHPQNKWDWETLTFHKNITWEIISQNLDKPWSWWKVSRHPSVTWDIISANPTLQWDSYGITQNPNITWDIIETQKPPFPPYEWNWFGVSESKNVTWDIIQSHPFLPWNWYALSKNPNITQEIFTKNPDSPWNIIGLSHNPNISLQDILSHPTLSQQYNYTVTTRDYTYMIPFITKHYINMCKGVCSHNNHNNHFLITATEIAIIINKNFKARKIQRAWRHAITNPIYKVCQRRLLIEIKELNEKIEVL